jgi:hypothetical protein
MGLVHLHVHGACLCPWCMSMSKVHVHVYGTCPCPCQCPSHLCVFINAGRLDCLASNQSGTGIKKNKDAGTDPVRTEPMQSSIFWVWYQTEIMDAGMLMQALVSSMLMPSYAQCILPCALKLLTFLPPLLFLAQRF